MAGLRPVWAEVDCGAIRANARQLARAAAPAALCAVVKANGYGHGAVEVARAALEGGATWLAVALVEEGLALRAAGIEEPVLLLSEPPHDAMGDVVGASLVPTVYTPEGVQAAAKAAAAWGAAALPVHLKVDTGMHRVGAPPGEVLDLARTIAGAPELAFDGLWTHLAVADVPDDPFTAEQLLRFDGVRAELAGSGLRPRLVHAANSAGMLAHPAARHDLVRCGITLYGLPPSPVLDGLVHLVPAMSLRARVSLTRRVPAGDRVSYGLQYRCAEPTLLATVPIGYADGVPRALGSAGGEVLIGGRRRPLAGTVTMDAIMADCGDPDDCGDDGVCAGDEVVLLGRQGNESIGAGEWAELLGTIPYEVVCGVGPRVPRVYLR